jgi:Fe-S cluster assembly scaffold protein SufB
LSANVGARVVAKSSATQGAAHANGAGPSCGCRTMLAGDISRFSSTPINEICLHSSTQFGCYVE